MLAYKPDLDPTFFTTRFIEGLSREIKAVVMIQRPEDLETAVALALLQEEIADDAPKMQFKPGISRLSAKTTYSSAPTKPIFEDRSASLSSKVTALKNYRFVSPVGKNTDPHTSVLQLSSYMWWRNG